MLSTIIFLYCEGGQGCVFKCSAIELVSDKWSASRLDNVVVVKPTYVVTFFLSEIESSKGYLNWYKMLIF